MCLTMQSKWFFFILDYIIKTVLIEGLFHGFTENK